MNKVTPLIYTVFLLILASWHISVHASCTKEEIMNLVDKGFNKEDIINICGSSNNESSGSSEPSRQAGRFKVKWRDHAIYYDGVLRIERKKAIVLADMYDIKTQRFIARRSYQMNISNASDEVTFDATFEVPWDSTSNRPHRHPVVLIFHKNRDGEMGVKNCNSDTNECYEAELSSE